MHNDSDSVDVFIFSSITNYVLFNCNKQHLFIHSCIINIKQIHPIKCNQYTVSDKRKCPFNSKLVLLSIYVKKIRLWGYLQLKLHLILKFEYKHIISITYLDISVHFASDIGREFIWQVVYEIRKF